MPTDTPEPLSDAVPKYSAREIADWRKKHVPVILRGPEPQKHCGFDDAPWPCFTIAALNGWDALKAAREELEQARADIMELLAAKLPEGTTLHRMATTYPKMRQRMLSDADNEIAKLRQRAESAEADCAALREQMSRATGVIGCEGYVDDEFEAVLAQPNPGAGVLERLRRYEGKALAYDDISNRLDEVQAYCKRYLVPDVWGRNVWHSILDDAIELRAKLERAERVVEAVRKEHAGHIVASGGWR